MFVTGWHKVIQLYYKVSGHSESAFVLCLTTVVIGFIIKHQITYYQLNSSNTTKINDVSTSIRASEAFIMQKKMVYSFLPVLDTTGRRRVKKAVVCVAQLVAHLITVHGLLSFLSWTVFLSVCSGSPTFSPQSVTGEKGPVSSHVWRMRSWQESSPISTLKVSHLLHYSKTSTVYPLNGEASIQPPWRIKHAHWPANLPVRSPNCYNNIYPHGLCDLPLLFNSVPRYNLEFLARVHFESQHQKSGIYCLLVSVILHHSLHFVGI